MATEKSSTSTQLKELDALVSEAEGLVGPGGSVDVKPDRMESRKSMSGLVGMLFAIGFGWFLPAWRVGKDEIEKLAEGWGAVLSKHLPSDLVEKLAGTGAGGVDVEIGALKVTWDVLYPRVSSKGGEPDQSKPAEPDKQKPASTVSRPPVEAGKDADGDNMLIIGSP